MDSESQSCIVSPLTVCNHATTLAQNETCGETSTQPMDLLALAQRVLDKNKCNISRNKSATYGLHHGAASQRSELRKLISMVSQNYGGDDEDFLASYIDEIIILHSHDLSVAIECFKDIATQRNPFNKWK